MTKITTKVKFIAYNGSYYVTSYGSSLDIIEAELFESKNGMLDYIKDRFVNPSDYTIKKVLVSIEIIE